jgi:hypothetical protein
VDAERGLHRSAPCLTAALEGLSKPLELVVDFDAKAVDQILARLSVLRVMMQPS